MITYLLFFEGTPVKEKRKPHRKGVIEKVLHSSQTFVVRFENGKTKICSAENLERLKNKKAEN